MYIRFFVIIIIYSIKLEKIHTLIQISLDNKDIIHQRISPANNGQTKISIVVKNLFVACFSVIIFQLIFSIFRPSIF